MQRNAVIVGNSDGIGLGFTIKLLQQGWTVNGISRSSSPIHHTSYTHQVLDVQADEFTNVLDSTVSNIQPLDLCVYCAGIGELLNVNNMSTEESIFKVNLVGLIRTASVVIPRMVDQRYGHFIGLSSVADDMLSFEAPSYHASKAGFSNYLEGLALALISKKVAVTNVRFGFVDTKMAKSEIKPFLLSVESAVKHLMCCLKKKPIRYTAPKIVIPMIWLRRWALKLKTIF